MPRPTVMTPQWSQDVWDDIRTREFENGGWYHPERRKTRVLVVERDRWSLDWEPPSPPDPPNIYRIDRSEWDKLAGGELLVEDNVIIRGGIRYVMLALDYGEARRAVVVRAS